MIMKKKRFSRDVWEMHLWKWKQSDLSITEYCSKHSLSRPSFYKWKGMLDIGDDDFKKVTSPKYSENDFVPVKVEEKNRPTEAKTRGELPIKLSFTAPSGNVVAIETSDFDLMARFYAHLRDLG